MEDNFFDISLITDYLEGKMPQPMKAKFELALQTNPDLAQEVTTVQDMLQGIRLFEQDRLKNLIQQSQQQLAQEGFFEEHVSEKPKSKALVLQKKPIFFGVRWVLAASFLLLVGVFSYFYIDKSPSVEQLYSTNFHPDTNKLDKTIQELSLSGFATTDADQKASLLAGLEAYKARKYEQAISLLESHIIKFKNNTTDAELYLALAFMAANQYEKAENVLKTSANNDTKWYLSLTLLKNNKKPEAVNILKSLSAIENTYQAQATTLLRQLEK